MGAYYGVLNRCWATNLQLDKSLRNAKSSHKKKKHKKTGWIISNLYLYAYGLVGLFLKRAYIVSILNSKCVGGSLLHQKMVTGDLLERMFRPGC